MSLTTKQQELLEFIKSFIKKHSFSPTQREIKDALNISSFSYLNKSLRRLEDLKLIKRNQTRTKNNISLLHHPYTLPLLGKIAAGSPIEVIPQVEEVNILGDNRYLLKVKGDSMIEEDIYDGDLVICEKCQNVPNGTIVVALVNRHEATLKRFFYEKGKVYLKPANKCHKVQIYSPEEVEVQGKYIGIIRLNN